MTCDWCHDVISNLEFIDKLLFVHFLTLMEVVLRFQAQSLRMILACSAFLVTWLICFPVVLSEIPGAIALFGVLPCLFVPLLFCAFCVALPYMRSFSMFRIPAGMVLASTLSLTALLIARLACGDFVRISESKSTNRLSPKYEREFQVGVFLQQYVLALAVIATSLGVCWRLRKRAKGARLIFSCTSRLTEMWSDQVLRKVLLQEFVIMCGLSHGVISLLFFLSLPLRQWVLLVALPVLVATLPLCIRGSSTRIKEAILSNLQLENEADTFINPNVDPNEGADTESSVLLPLPSIQAFSAIEESGTRTQRLVWHKGALRELFVLLCAVFVCLALVFVEIYRRSTSADNYYPYSSDEYPLVFDEVASLHLWSQVTAVFMTALTALCVVSVFATAVRALTNAACDRFDRQDERQGGGISAISVSVIDSDEDGGADRQEEDDADQDFVGRDLVRHVRAVVAGA
ncbi:MAG: hypothetical protein MHM6MM_006623 [Cercozoa sp. M6MM]